jgi:hypothetical protein
MTMMTGATRAAAEAALTASAANLRPRNLVFHFSFSCLPATARFDPGDDPVCLESSFNSGAVRRSLSTLAPFIASYTVLRKFAVTCQLANNGLVGAGWVHSSEWTAKGPVAIYLSFGLSCGLRGTKGVTGRVDTGQEKAAAESCLRVTHCTGRSSIYANLVQCLPPIAIPPCVVGLRSGADQPFFVCAEGAVLSGPKKISLH